VKPKDDVSETFLKTLKGFDAEILAAFRQLYIILPKIVSRMTVQNNHSGSSDVEDR
jgi:hypothetical protein